MMFFDNQSNNCVDVSKVNVTVAYVPDGITRLVKEIFVLSIADCYSKDNKIIIKFLGAHSRRL